MVVRAANKERGMEKRTRIGEKRRKESQLSIAAGFFLLVGRGYLEGVYSVWGDTDRIESNQDGI